MEILPNWEATPLIGERPYERLLREPGDAVEYCPPSLSNLDRVMAVRRAHVQNCIDRRALAEDLLASHARRGAPDSSRKAIESLREDDCFLIITGQQPGLLGGPLFTFYKILHAIVLAKRLTRERPETFLPAFWDASEDRDFPEIATMQWLSKERKTVSFTWPGDPASRRPYAGISMGECPLDELLDRIRDTTHPTEFTEPIIASIREAARGVDSYPDFFDRLMWSLFADEGLIVIRPDDPWFRRRAVPLWETEIHDPQRSTAGVERIGTLLKARGLSPQIHKRADRASFFLLEEGERLAVSITPEGFATEGGHTYTASELRRRLHERPEDFSPSAILRPAIQDAVLPTAAAVLGPSEVAYHFLLHDIYSAHKIPRPCLVPRFGFTLIDKREFQQMERYGLQPADLMESTAALMKHIAREDSAEAWKPARRKAETGLEELFDIWKVIAQEADPTIVPVLNKNRLRIQKELEQSESLLVRKIGEKNQQVQQHLDGLQQSLFPNGTLQERQYNPFVYLMKYGPEWLVQFKALGNDAKDGSHSFVLIP